MAARMIASASPPRSNLPRERTLFVGRTAELASLRAHFESGERLVSLIAPSGMGKTRLALRHAREELSFFEEHGGAWLCDLTEARSPDDLVDRLASALGAPLADPEGIGATLSSRGPLLLVLDNCEHLGEEARAMLESLLDRAPEARVLATSLVRLGLRSELSIELPPLEDEEAVELYLEHARRADPAASPDRPAVGELVRRLDRNPLAIQLAAARARTLRPTQLLGRLDKRLSLLHGGTPGRHQSLRNAIRCSWELLSPFEARALAQCAIFAGGFTLEAAEAVLDPGEGAPPIVDLIEALRDKALLRADAGDPPRYGLYESIRDYGLDELARSGGTSAAFVRHARYFVSLAPEPEDGALGVAEIRRLVAEYENLLVAHRRMLELDPALAVRAALGLEPLLIRSGHPPSAAAIFDAAESAARNTGDDRLVARSLRARAALRYRQRDFSGARRDLEEAIGTASEGRALRTRLHAGHDLALVGLAEGQTELARSMTEEVLAAATSDGALFLAGLAENLLGVVAYTGGRHDEAVSHFERAAIGLQRCGRTRNQAMATLNIGVARAAQARVSEARRAYEAGCELVRALDDRGLLADAMVNLGSLALVEGDLEAAEALLGRARVLERELCHPIFEGIACGNLATIFFERGRIRSALRLYDEALSTFRSCGHVRYQAAFGAFTAAALAAAGEIDAARSEFAKARHAIQAIGDAGILAVCDLLEGFVDLAEARRSPQKAEAERLLARARARSEAQVSTTADGQRQMALRLLCRALAGWSDATAAPAPAPAALPAAGLVIGPDAMWFELPGHGRCDLRRRKPIRRLLQALVEQRLLAPGIGLTQEKLFAAGWPGEKAMAGAAAGRVYVAIRTLRAAGLEEMLLRQDDGYLIDPAVAVHRPADGVHHPE